jgi:putative DNA primase/helicase
MFDRDDSDSPYHDGATPVFDPAPAPDAGEPNGPERGISIPDAEVDEDLRIANPWLRTLVHSLGGWDLDDAITTLDVCDRIPPHRDLRLVSGRSPGLFTRESWDTLAVDQCLLVLRTWTDAFHPDDLKAGPKAGARLIALPAQLGLVEACEGALERKVRDLYEIDDIEPIDLARHPEHGMQPIEKLARRNRGKTSRMGGVTESNSSGIQAPASSGPKPQIIIDDVDMHGTVQAAIDALAASDVAVYTRARQLMHVVNDPSGLGFLVDRSNQPVDTMVITAVKKYRLRELLSRSAEWFRESTDDEGRRVLVRSSPPMWIVSTILERDQWPELNALEGVVHAPTLRADGSILNTPGYDARTRLIYRPDGAYPEIPESPTFEDALLAWDELIDPLCDFPYVAESDRSAVVSAVLTLIARAAIDKVPQFGFLAPTAGSGKTLQADIVSMIVLGREVAKMGNTDDEEEQRKRLTSIALAGVPFVLVDNVVGNYGDGQLARATTAGVVSDRLLGGNQLADVPFRALIGVSGNNIVLVDDMGRRLVPVEINPGVERPELRDGFRYPDVLEHVRANRGKLVAAALTILRAYWCAGKPSHKKPLMGSFESWDKIVRGAILWLKKADPLDGMARLHEDGGNGDFAARDSLFRALRDRFGDKQFTSRDVSEKSVGGAPEAVALREALGTCDAKEIGFLLRGAKGQVAGKLSLKHLGRDKAGVQWQVVERSAKS